MERKKRVCWPNTHSLPSPSMSLICCNTLISILAATLTEEGKGKREGGREEGREEEKEGGREGGREGVSYIIHIHFYEHGNRLAGDSKMSPKLHTCRLIWFKCKWKVCTESLCTYYVHIHTGNPTSLAANCKDVQLAYVACSITKRTWTCTVHCLLMGVLLTVDGNRAWWSHLGWSECETLLVTS